MDDIDPITIAPYCRVSTSDKSQDPESQLTAIRAHAERSGWIIVEEFIDHGYSGSHTGRPALGRLMKAAWEGKFDTVVVTRFDRFARSPQHLLTALDTFRSLHINFISLAEQFDTSTPIGQAMFVIIGAMGQLERDILRERVRCGLAHARANGVKLGRPASPIDAQRIVQLKREGLSIRSIAKELGGSPSLIHKILSRQATGTT